MSLGETIETILIRVECFCTHIIFKETFLKDKNTIVQVKCMKLKTYLNGKYVWNDFAFTNISFNDV